ncbi:hypothetical protein NBH15_03560 [Parabacteroides sp. W1-Q-101]|uniref:hypothetical protein n=1 Tax=Parabacteroides caeci TaxID=2949650 RepID=UPI00202E825D|nr:hypothetical protein [Parabacteroides sp. W1-Q-101]MCM0717349.1 hypothetical protein [Parabacteroides sp. W1-Q-101]
MNCIELISDIIKIEAYADKDVHFSIPFTHDRVVRSSAVTLSGTPLLLSLKEGTAEARCSMETSESGDRFDNSLTWQVDDNRPDTLQQIGILSSGRYHYMITTYGGIRKFIYNWCGAGRTLPDSSMSGNTETTSMKFSVTGRHPILTLI